MLPIFFYIHGFVHRESNWITVQQVATVFSLLHFCRQLYMFRALTPIFRSSYSCNYSFWHWSAGSIIIRSRCWVSSQQLNTVAFCWTIIHLPNYVSLRSYEIIRCHVPWPLIVGANEGYSLPSHKKEEIEKVTIANNHGIHWPLTGKWWNYPNESNFFLNTEFCLQKGGFF